MNWEVVAALAELLGAMAVVATLAYLALQVKHSRELLEENRRISMSTVYATRAGFRLNDFQQDLSSPETIRLLAERDGKTEDEVRLWLLANRSVVFFDNMLYQNELGLLEEADLRRATQVIIRLHDNWVESGAMMFDRVENWYQEHKDA